ncbi:MAG: ATP-binding protein [Actinomycetales bacterium]
MTRLARLPLTRRLGLTFAAGALLLSTVLAGSAYALTWQFLVRQQERNGLQQAYVNAALARQTLRSPDADVPQLLQSLTTVVASTSVIEVHGRWYSSGLLIGRDALPLTLRTTAFDGQVATMWAPIGGQRRLAVAVPLPEVSAAYFEVFDVETLAGTLDVLRAVLLVTALATTTAGGLTGWWASRRLAAPLTAVTAAATRIAEGNLKTRMQPSTDPELARLVDSFNAMVDALAARIERDARFAADVSHELRSPLTTMATSLSILESRSAELSPRAGQGLQLLSGEVHRFQQLVEDLLEMAKSDSAERVREPLRPAELVMHVLDRAGAERMPVEVEAAAMEATVVGDKRRLEQALRNLLDNANQHAGGGAEVRLRRTQEAIVIEIHDRGPGVPPAERDVVFQRFARGRSAARRGTSRGTGLGLALVREHVEAHSGRVWVEDSPLGGACFVIELPLADEGSDR